MSGYGNGRSDGQGNGRSSLIDHSLERVVAGTLIFRSDLLERAHPEFGLDVVADFHATAVITAVANVRERGQKVDVDTVARELVQAGHASIDHWYPRLVASVPDPIDPSLFIARTASLVRLARMRREIIRNADEPARIESEIDDFALRDAEAPAPPPKPWKRAPQLVAAIMERAKDPWIALTVGGETIARVRVGSTIAVMGGSGSGKSSLTLEMCGEHAEHVGPAIVLSIELPEEEAGARIVGQKCDASWEDALTGKVDVLDMERALNLPRLYILDRRRATIKNLERAIRDAQAEYPGQPILIAIDYAQLMDSKEREIRQKIADIFQQIDDVARELKVVVLALSQMSRANAQKARSGDAIGGESADLGAESPAIERFATLTLTIGKSTEREDGSSAVELSVGKARMGKGDRVYPMTYWGRSGLWRVAGDAQKAEEVREKRVTERYARDDKTIEAAMVTLADKSPNPLTRTDLKRMVSGNAARKAAAIARLVQQHELVEVNRRATKGAKKGDWLLWTARAAALAGVPTVDQVVNGLFEGIAPGGVE